MTDIKITVADKKATLVGTPIIVCGNSDYTVTFSFDSEWSAMGPRTARFVYIKNGEKQHEDVVFSGSTVAVPVLADVAFVQVGVFEGNLATTTPARVLCSPSILCGTGSTPDSLTEDVYNQLLALVVDLAEKGAFGATEEQMQQVEQNTRNIAALDTKKADQAEMDLLAARMDTFTKLEEGSTTGDAELADIRVGANGVTYETAGDAVRGQIGELKETLGSHEKLFKEISVNLNRMGYLDATGAVQYDGMYRATDFIEIFNKEIFYEGTFGNSPVFVAFYDSDMNYISGNSEYGTITKRKLAVPDGTRFIRLSNYIDYVNTVKVYVADYTEKRVHHVNSSTNLRTFFDSLDESIENIVYMERGVYDVNTYYAASEWNDSIVGLVVPNNTTLIGTSNREDTKIYAEAAENLYEVSTLHLKNNCKLFNLTVEARNLRYAIHDDAGNHHVGYTHIIENCDIIGHNCTYDYAYGCGLQQNARLVFKNCNFVSDEKATSKCLGVHNNIEWTYNSYVDLINCRMTSNDDGTIDLLSITNHANGTLTYVTMVGTKLSNRLRNLEHNPANGSGLLFKVSGYGNVLGGVVVYATDGEDYSNFVDLL